MELYTVIEASKKLKTSKDTVYKLLKVGLIKGMKLGHMKIPDFEIERFLKENLGKDLTNLEAIKDLESAS